ncbi:polysaccharide deacetylase family protein [Psychroserpens sp. MEBiC05023]
MKIIRKFLGNLFGFFLFSLKGKSMLLNDFDDSKVLSIYFHNPSVKVFETLIKWFLRHDFHIITLSEFKQSVEKKKSKHKRTVFISFDDAWQGNLELTAVLKKYNIPITLFVAPKAIDDGDIWLNFVRQRFQQLNDHLTSGVSVNNIKSLPASKAFELYEAAKELGDIKRNIMTKSELLEFAKVVTIGSHTVNHPILVNCENDVILEEFNESEKILKSWGLNPNNSLAYPNGSYNQNTLDVLRQTNYEFAFTTQPEFVVFSSQKNSFEIPRICVPDGFGKYENLARISSIWSKIFKDE